LTLNVIRIYWYLEERGRQAMRGFVKRIIRNEKGHGLDMVLALLGLGGLILAPTLGLMSTGLLAGEVYEHKTDELYAADAGVEDAVWKIHNQVDEVQGLSPCYPEYSYNMSEVNGSSVEVTITYVTNTTYRVDSIASFNGSATQVEAYIAGESYYGDYGDLMEHVLISPGPINVAKKVIVDPPDPYPTDEHGVYSDYPGDWPLVWEFEEFYGQQVEDGMQYAGYTQMDLDGNDCPIGPVYINDEAVDCPSGLEPLFVDGELDVLNGGAEATLTLNGTMYVTGDTQIGATNGDMVLDLNGQTIFVSSNTTGNQKALVVGGKCIVKGPGILIAIGDIEFKPKSQAGVEEGGGPVFVMSVYGTTTLQPSGTVYGAIAGGIEVYVQQGEEPTIEYPEGGFDGEGLNFLTGVIKLVYQVDTWEVSGA
jgi:hypothetical protein